MRSLLLFLSQFLLGAHWPVHGEGRIGSITFSGRVETTATMSTSVARESSGQIILTWAISRTGYNAFHVAGTRPIYSGGDNLVVIRNNKINAAIGAVAYASFWRAD